MHLLLEGSIFSSSAEHWNNNFLWIEQAIQMLILWKRAVKVATMALFGGMAEWRKQKLLFVFSERSEGGQPEAAPSEGKNTKYILEEWLSG